MHEVLPGSFVTFAVALVRLQRASVVFKVSVHVEKLSVREPPDTLFRAKPAAAKVPCCLVSWLLWQLAAACNQPFTASAAPQQ
eukprot:691829-Pelagomonas_calceolata.AAC.1